MNQITKTQTNMILNRNQNGDFGLLPIEIWNYIYEIKTELEVQDLKNNRELSDKYQELSNEHLYKKCTYMIKHIIEFKNDFTFIYDFLKSNLNDNEQTELLENAFYDNNYDTCEEMKRIINLKKPRKRSIEQFCYNMIMYLRECINEGQITYSRYPRDWGCLGDVNLFEYTELNEKQIYEIFKHRLFTKTNNYPYQKYLEINQNKKEIDDQIDKIHYLIYNNSEEKIRKNQLYSHEY